MRFPHFVLVILVGLSTWMLHVQGAVQQDIKFDIARAESFYYQGQYKEALELLTPLDDKLKNAADNVDDRAKVKMLAGINEVALGDNGQARKHFLEFCNLVPNYVLDETQYPTKIVTVFKEAQQECSKCVEICTRMESLTAAGNAKAVSDMKADTESCGCAAKILARDDAALKRGRDLFAQGKFQESLREFQAALTAIPVSTARREAVLSTQTKINSQAESAVGEWRQQFSSRDFERAAATYDRIRALEGDTTGTVREAVRQVTAQYQTTFESVAAAWDTACTKSDKVALLTIREWGLSLDPKRTIQPEVLDRMRECTKPAAPKGDVAK
jgi:tetratricopeptide (TPR) repeat protein